MSQIKEEFKTIMERKNCGEEGSYTNYLFNKGTEKITKKNWRRSYRSCYCSNKG